MQNKFFAEIIISTLLYRHVDFISYYIVSFALFMDITFWGRKLGVLVAVWIRESGLRPPTNVRSKSKPAASRAPPKALTSQARIGQVRLLTLQTRTILTHLNPSTARLARQNPTCVGALNVLTTQIMVTTGNFPKKGIIPMLEPDDDRRWKHVGAFLKWF